MGAWNGIELNTLSLADDRLTLRPWRATDAPVVHRAMQDRSLHEFLALPDPYTEADARAWVTTLSAAGREAGTGFASALVETGSGRVVGGADLRLPRAGEPGADIGYLVYADARGQGYAAQASRLLASWALAHDVPRVQIRAAVANIASIRTASQAGFRYEGIERASIVVTGTPADAAVFARVGGDLDGPMVASFAPLPPDLSDGVVRLRVVRPEDAAALLDEQNNAEALRWTFSGAVPLPAEARAQARRAQLDWLVGGQAMMAVVDVATDEVTGTLTVRSVGPPGVGGIGYGLRPAWRGRGYTARALRLVRRWAFTAGGFNRLELGAKTGNVASQRAARSGGFLEDGTRVGRLRNPDGTYSDEVRFVAFSPS